MRQDGAIAELLEMTHTTQLPQKVFQDEHGGNLMQDKDDCGDREKRSKAICPDTDEGKHLAPTRGPRLVITQSGNRRTGAGGGFATAGLWER